ncbi:hypothetical protein BGP75_24180 [Motiliproteus sp. MSK22-1]|nr:hypothetical protein BGP75_24180 [Motiliproteus sp. MSK22-1]
MGQSVSRDAVIFNKYGTNNSSLNRLGRVKAKEGECRNKLTGFMTRLEEAKSTVREARSKASVAKLSGDNYQKYVLANRALQKSISELKRINTDMVKAHIDIRNASNQHQTPLLKKYADISNEVMAMVSEDISYLSKESDSIVKSMRDTRNKIALNDLIKRGENGNEVDRLLANVAEESLIDSRVEDAGKSSYESLESRMRSLTDKPKESELWRRLRELRS